MNGELSMFILDCIRAELRASPCYARNAYFKIKVGGHQFQTIVFKRKTENHNWVYIN